MLNFGKEGWSMNPYVVLVVDDDKEICDGIEIYLKNEGMKVLKARDGVEALECLTENQVHLILLDIMMPKMDGITATFKIREQRNIPIIMLSAKSEDTDKILGLQVGADDYITKPFNPLELIARVKSQLRRYVTLGTFEGINKTIDLNGLTLDSTAKEVAVNGEPVKLTPIEYKIVELLMVNAGRVFSISDIYERVWNEPNFNAENTVAVHIRKIREKIEIDPKNPRYLKVVWGIGYKMEK
jgi:DNA-binding response OmpR family regulator